MSQIDDYNAVLAIILAIPANQVKFSNIPIVKAIQEAENLAITAKKYEPQLTSVGLQATSITQLTVRANALKEAQSRWQANYNSGQGPIKQWDELSPQGYALQRKLNQAFRYAFRNEPRILGRVKEIADGSGDDDMIQDLNDYAVLGKANPALLEKANFNLAELDNAALLSENLSDLLAQANGTKDSEHNFKDIRDRAFTHLKELVDEIRACGKYVFADQPEIKKLFASTYLRKHRSQPEPQVNA
ncbi:MAG: hypothetical protein JXA53_00410, partial [Bacteroidales bacterium]|nr:hypothetical protein [Bacteroidales bacterium]